MRFRTFSPMCFPSGESDRHAISARLRSGGGYRSDVNYGQSIEKLRFRLFKKVSDARRACTVIVSVKRDGEIRSTNTSHEHEFVRGDRAQRQTV
jgi:hypothetical protein